MIKLAAFWISIIIFIIVFLFYFGICIFFFLLQLIEKKILLKFNFLDNNQIIKRNKYINSIATSNQKLKLVADFFYNSILIFEEKIKITKNNIVNLKKLKLSGNLFKYSSLLFQIQNDVDKLEEEIKIIDNYVLNSKNYKDITLNLLIKLKKNFYFWISFYEEQLLPVQYGNQNFYQLIDLIKNKIKEIHESLQVINEKEIIKQFYILIDTLHDFNLRLYYSVVYKKKIQKIHELLAPIKKFYSSNSLFTIEEHKAIEKKLNFIKENYQNSLNTNKILQNISINKIIEKMIFYIFLLNEEYVWTENANASLENWKDQEIFFSNLKEMCLQCQNKLNVWLQPWALSSSSRLLKVKMQCEKIIECWNKIDFFLLLNKKQSVNFESTTKREKIDTLFNLLSCYEENKKEIIELLTLIICLDTNYKKIINSLWNLKYFFLQIKELANILFLPNNQLTLIIENNSQKIDNLINSLKTNDLNELETIEIINYCENQKEISNQILISFNFYLLTKHLLNYYFFLIKKYNKKKTENILKKIEQFKEEKNWEQLNVLLLYEIKKIKKKLLFFRLKAWISKSRMKKQYLFHS